MWQSTMNTSAPEESGAVPSFPMVESCHDYTDRLVVNSVPEAVAWGTKLLLTSPVACDILSMRLGALLRWLGSPDRSADARLARRCGQFITPLGHVASHVHNDPPTRFPTPGDTLGFPLTLIGSGKQGFAYSQLHTREDRL